MRATSPPAERHIVFVTSGIASLVSQNLELARRLAAAGYRVTYASPADVRDAVEDVGLPFLHLAAAAGSAAPRRSRLARFARAPRLAARRREAIEGLGVEAAVSALEGLRPDLVLIDLELHAYVIAASGRGLRVALVSTWLAMWKRPGLAPLHHYVLPAPGWRGRIAVEWAWLRYRLWKLARRRLDWLRRAGADRVSVLRALAARTRFDFRAEVDLWQWPFPFSYRRLPLLLHNALELDLPHVPPPHVRYVGPTIREPEPGDPADPVEHLLSRPRAGSGARPLVYVGFGAFYKGDDAPFIGRVLEAVGARPDLDVVVGLGGRLEPEALGPLPEHVHVFSWVPQARVVSQAAAALLHGGITSINECLWFGVPVLVYPFRTNDQLGTAVRVEHHGLGIVGDRDEDDAADIGRKLERVLSDPAFRERARRMRDRLRAYERDGRGVAAVRELLGDV